MEPEAWHHSTSYFEDLEEQEVFYESLKLRPLQDGRLSSAFEFVIIARNVSPVENDLEAEETSRHYRVFPLALGQLLRRYAVNELHLSMNAGKWNYPSWGFPEDLSASSGADLWAWISSGNSESAKQRWKGLTNGLSGLFCASLSALDEKRTTYPSHAFRPEGDLPADSSNSLFYAPLPSESVCTENLTPFLKLLPCKSRSGIAMLLHPHQLFDADWHGMGVHVRWLEGDNMELRLTVGAVFDAVRLSGLKRDWSFRSTFGGAVSRSCPVASSSEVHVHLPFADPYALTPEVSRGTPNGIAVFDLSDVREEVNVAMHWPEQKFQPRRISPKVPISIHRALLGDQARAKLSIRLENHVNQTQEVLWLETMPWFINFYLHTLSAAVDGVPTDGLIDILSYNPPSGHQPTLLESTVQIPPLSTLQISLSLDKAFIAYTEHPPDASRGWDLPAGVFSFVDRGIEQRIYTNSLLGDLPTPDFSMPYNVIIMTSTLVALFFGGVFNLLTRSFFWVKLGDEGEANINGDVVNDSPRTKGD